MKRSLLLAFVLIAAFVSCNGPAPAPDSFKAYCWSGEMDGNGQASAWIGIRDSDGLIAGEISFGGSTYALHGEDGLKEGSIINAFLFNDIFQVGAIEITVAPDSSMEGTYWDRYDQEFDIRMKPTDGEAPRNPFEHPAYGDLKVASDWVCGLRYEGDYNFTTVSIYTPGGNKVAFHANDGYLKTKWGTFDPSIYPDSEGASAMSTVKYDGGKAVFPTEGRESIVVEFFKDFMVVSLDCGEGEEYNAELEFMAGTFPLQSIYDDFPVCWTEGEGEEGDNWIPAPKFGDVAAIREQLVDGSFRGVHIPVEVASGSRPGIEEFFKAFAAQYPGILTDNAFNSLYNGLEIEICHAVMNKRAGYLNSANATDSGFNEGMQMCYWNTPTDHSIVAAVLNYFVTDANDDDVRMPDWLMLFYEYDTEKHTLNPICSTSRFSEWASWAIDPAFDLGGTSVVNADEVILPEKGKNILFNVDGMEMCRMEWDDDSWFSVAD